MKTQTALLVILLLVSTATALPKPTDPHTEYHSACSKEKHFVYDLEDMMSGTHARAMEHRGCQFYQDTQAHFVFISTANTEGKELEVYAEELFNYWGIGSKDRGDGIMLLYTLTKPDGKPGLYVGAGAGIHDVLTDSKATAFYNDAVRMKQSYERNGMSEPEATQKAIREIYMDIADWMDTRYENGDFVVTTQAEKERQAEIARGVAKGFMWLMISAASLFIVIKLLQYNQKIRARRRQHFLENSMEPEAVQWRKERDEKERQRKLAEAKRRREEAERRKREAEEKQLAASATGAATVSCKSCWQSRRACRHGYADDSIMTHWLTWVFVYHVFFSGHEYRSSYSRSSYSSSSSSYSSDSFGGFGGFGGGGFGGGGGGSF